ncbi:GvpL/GvpF family gas vesicle protein [Streptomyces sp. B6B3]|uniref:GvpL/GvpF family gas vesicle protein n=1 Tax=Streptomyces sp. B6B3 TaxID=3153570 RepID=UPI00325EB164
MTTYVYGITRSTVPDPVAGADRDGGAGTVDGVGDPPHRVRVLREGDLAAVVSDCPAGLRPKRRDLLAHQRVLAAVARTTPVLPLRFGSVSADDSRIRATLAEHAELYREQLAALADRDEYNVKAGHREEAVLRRILAENPEIQALSEAIRQRGGEATYQDRVQLGQLIAEAVRDHEIRDAHAMEEALAPFAERHCWGPVGAGRLVNLSFLVPRDDVDRFLAALERVKHASPHLEIHTSGALPPYSFVRTSETVDAAGTPRTQLTPQGERP